jgi:DnaJ-class molecular chaperone
MDKASTLYDVLGVSRDASMREIKHAYRQLVRRYHPDLQIESAAAQEMLKTINIAAETLCDPHARASYDTRLQQSATRYMPRDIRSDGYDVEYMVTIGEAEAHAGTSRTLRFHGPDGRPREMGVVIQPGAYAGQRLTIRGAGGPSEDGTRHGDLHVVVRVAHE